MKKIIQSQPVQLVEVRTGQVREFIAIPGPEGPQFFLRWQLRRDGQPYSGASAAQLIQHTEGSYSGSWAPLIEAREEAAEAIRREILELDRQARNLELQLCTLYTSNLHQ